VFSLAHSIFIFAASFATAPWNFRVGEDIATTPAVPELI
jgi:hypothetical protein